MLAYNAVLVANPGHSSAGFAPEANQDLLIAPKFAVTLCENARGRPRTSGSKEHVEG